MGKTAAGALFIDTARTSVFDYYQYWRNVDDRDVVDCLLRFTDCEAAKVATLLTAASPAGALTDMTPASTTDRRSLATPTTQINAAKAYLAYEATRFAHGDEAAETAAAAAQALFGGSAATPVAGSTTAHAASTGSAPAGRTAIPGGNITTAALAAGISVIDLFAATPLCSSKSAARRLIEQGGAQINGTKITDSATVITVQWAPQRRLSLQAGKKRHWMLTVGD